MPKSRANSKSRVTPNDTHRPGKSRAEKTLRGPMGVVGLGASAGGIGALQRFFAHMPGDSGLAFVVVMHLSPEHESNLAHVLQAVTSMPVIQVQDEVKTKANTVYVIPPNKHLAMRRSTLFLSEPQQAVGRRVAIDLFFRTLAEAYGQRAVCAVLSGTDSDGMIGLKYVKAQGGVTIAQDPEEAEYDSMPRRAIETGMVDWVLPVRQMPKKLVEFVQNEQRIALPPEKIRNGDGEDEPEREEEAPPGGKIVAQEKHEPDDEAALREVLVYLRSQSGHDFSHYKRATVLRRIARRLQVNSLANIPAYLDFLRAHTDEPDALLHDLLIGVTHFFRDHDAFAALEANVPQLFAGKQPNEQVSAWVPGCATGEEAYSLAILLCEQAGRLEAAPNVQVFATDIDDEAITAARAGAYPLTIEADVSQERLRRFFVREGGHYRIKKAIRETVLFAPHELLKDPPFSRLDLVSCRNLLIYIKRQPQERVLDLFHFALKAGGLLFIGGSESVDGANALFSPIDKRHRIYLRRAVPRPGWMIPALPARSRPVQETVLQRQTPAPVTGFHVPEAVATAADGEERRALLFGELHLKLLEQYGPPSVVINENNDVIHRSEHAGRYLQFGGGEPSADLLELVPPPLQLDLRSAIFRAGQVNGNVTVSNVAIEVAGARELLDVHVRPLRDGGESAGFTLVVFEKKTGEAPPATAAEPEHDALSTHLEAELQQTRQQLDREVEQYEAANEELKASNEELQAMNEELRSTAEELETSKEELQSVNEELTTVNQELKNNIEALGSANSDLQNLIGSTDITTIFLDRELRIKRFTPPAQKLFNVIPTDIGRPLAHVTHQLQYKELDEDAAKVLESLIAVQREVRDEAGNWFLTRLLPYRTLEDKIDGVVLTFVDISERKRVEEALQASEEQLRLAIEEAPIPVIMHAEDGQVLQISKTWTALTGYTSEEMSTFDAWINRAYGFGADAVRAQMQRLFKGDAKVEQAEFEIVTREGRRRHWSFSASAPGALRDGRRFVIGMALDITDRHRLSREIAGYLRRFDAMVAAVPDFIYSFDLEGRFTFANQPLLDLWGKSFEQAIGKNFRELDYPPELADKLQRQIQEVISTGQPLKDQTPFTGAAGVERQYEYIFVPLRGENGEVEEVAGVTRDITERQQTEADLLATKESLATEVSAMARLHDLSGRMLATGDVEQLLEQVLDAVIELQRADFGSIQLVNPLTGALEMVASRGFERRLLDHFAGRPDSSTTCGRALKQRERVIIEDVKKEPAYRKHRRAAAEAGYRAVQTTVLCDRSGATVGLLSTHFRAPHRPSERDLRLTDLYAKQAAEIVSLKLAEQTLRESRERFHLLVEGARDYAIFLIEPDNRISYWSAGAERIFGWRAEEAVGQSGELIFTPEDRAQHREEKERAIAQREGCANDCRWHIRKDGSRIWVDGVMRRLDDEQGNLRGFAKVARDATEQRAAEEKLKRSHLELERRVEKRTAELTATNQRLQGEMERRAGLEQEILLISEREKRRIGQDLHDSLCQELAAAAFFLQSTAHQVEKKNPGAAETLAAAAKIVNANVGLARDLARGLHPVELSVLGLTNALRELAFRASHAPVECLFGCPKPIRVRDDAVALNLYRIAQEAVTNAVKNGDAKKIVIQLARRRRRLVLTVTDNGKGFAPEKAPKGMGIHIMKYRANVIGGLLTVDSKEGCGTTVTCTLAPPQAADPASRPP